MRRRRWGVVLGSVAFHALLVALFVLDLARGPVAAPEPPPMTVFLERDAPRPRPSSRGGPGAPSVSTRTQAASAAPAAPSAPAAPIAVPASPPSSAVGPVAAEAPATGLRGLGGCRLATLDRLPADERARCQERLARTMDAQRGPRANLDPTGRFARDAKPYLTRPPHNGCKPVAGVKDDGPMGQTNATIGIGCAWSF